MLRDAAFSCPQHTMDIMMTTETHKTPARLTTHILIAMILGFLVGLAIRMSPLLETTKRFLIENFFQTGGDLFIDLMKMLVVPVVFISLVCGVSSLNEVGKLGRIGIKTIAFYLLTTAIAVSLALSMALIFKVGQNIHATPMTGFTLQNPPSLKEVVKSLIPSNPVNALSSGNMLQIIVFSLFLGSAIMLAGNSGEAIRKIFINLNEVIMTLVTLVMKIVPFGVFCLITTIFAKQGLLIVKDLFQYFVIVLLTLLIHASVFYSLILKFIANLNPLQFFRKMRSAMLFAFSVSSSNASIPIVLETVEDKLGVNNSVAAFVIPLGATINMDGTAIMQGVATIFISHAYNIDIGISGYLTVIFMATLASIGTAGVPGVGLITLGMVLKQVGLPMEGIALIIGIDRFLDMARTAVNITGDAVIACLVGRSENAFNMNIFNKNE